MLIEIAGQERCQSLLKDDNEFRDIRAVGRVAAMLMQGYVNENDSTSIDDLERWSTNARDFVSKTTSVLSVQELIEVS
jgi:hypothetical protein